MHDNCDNDKDKTNTQPQTNNKQISTWNINGSIEFETNIYIHWDWRAIILYTLSLYLFVAYFIKETYRN